MSTKKDDEKSADDTSPKIKSKPSSPTFSENSIVSSVEKAISAGSIKKVVDKSKNEKPVNADRAKSRGSNEKNRSETSKLGNSRQNQAIGKSSQSQDEAIPVERKVSRYSERRNKNKEIQALKLVNAAESLPSDVKSGD